MFGSNPKLVRLVFESTCNIAQAKPVALDELGCFERKRYLSHEQDVFDVLNCVISHVVELRYCAFY